MAPLMGPPMINLDQFLRGPWKTTHFEGPKIIELEPQGSRMCLGLRI